MKNSTTMRRVIVDFKKLTPEILALLVAKYPDGYEPSDIIVFRNAMNEIIEAVEVKTEDTVYLVKVSQRLADTMENFDEDDEDDSYDDDENSTDFDDTEDSSMDDDEY